MHVVATAGHVDHGKSTLVHALTGIDPDRFAEEKQRGLTIDLGFAWATLPSGREVGFVDVPGHVRFLKNMLAGIGAVDACLFVVAATEGWKPQSEEHLRILELLGTARGVVALTKADLVDDDWRDLAIAEVEERVRGTFLAGAEIVPVAATQGTGVDDIALALDRVLATAPTATDRGRPRLWVDRSFAAKGAGTVVTGNLTGGSIAVDDDLVLVPGARRVRVRGLQTHRTALAEAAPGRRLAVNVTGVGHAEVHRGDALVRPDQWAQATTVDASLTVLAALDHEVSRRGAFHAYVGSGEHPVRLRVLGASAIAPGETGLVRMHLPVPLPLLPGDRYVLRDRGRSETVGGGEVLDVDPILPASRARPDRRTERVVAERGWVDAGELERLTGERRAADIGGRWVVDPDVLAGARRRLSEAVSASGVRGVDLAALDDRDRAVVATLDDVVVTGGRAIAAGVAGAESDGGRAYLAALDASPFAPPSPAEAGVAMDAVRQLVRRGDVVERDGMFFSRNAVSRAALVIAGLLATRAEGVTVSEVREALGTSRKFLLPLLAHLDATGVTRRRGDVRIAGPRLPAV